MKRLTALSVCVVLTMVANAGATIVLPVTVTAGGIGLVATLDTTSAPGYCVVDVFVTSLPKGETGLQIAQGEFDAIGGTFYVANKPATSATFQYDTTWIGMDAGGTPPYTAVNFSDALGAAVWARDGGTTHNTSMILGSWNDSGVAGDAITAGTNVDPAGGPTNRDGWAKNLLAQLVVTDTTTGIRGNFSRADPREVNGFGYSPTGDGITTQFVIGGPEPSTLALMGFGLFALLAYAWRQQRTAPP